MNQSEQLISRNEPLADGVIVAITGDIDFSRSPALRAGLLAALDAKPQRMVIDLSGVVYMDSSGVATLVEALQVQRNNNAKLVLCNLQPKVKGIFEIARLDMVFTIVDDEAAALDV